MRRTLCIRWLLLFTTIGMIAAILVGAALPIDSRHNIDLSQEVRLKSAYALETSPTLASTLYSARKLSHIVPLAGLFVATYFLARRRRVLTAATATMIVAIAIELEQGFVATRSAKVEDLVSALVAIFLAYLVLEKLGIARRGSRYKAN